MFLDNEISLGGWQELLKSEMEKPYMQELASFLKQEKKAKKQIYPEDADIFKALNTTDFDKVKVVMLGQDPYHGLGQAHGFCFSVKKGVVPPPSLVNIYKELESDVGFVRPSHGYLHDWALQGVLLLNSVLTVEHGLAGSHQNKGWEQLTDAIIKKLSNREQPMVFMLWGGYAKRKGRVIDSHRHLVLEAPHPSPLSAYRGFLGCKHFSKANAFLESHGAAKIDWQIHP